MEIYVVIINWSLSMDSDIDMIFWDHDAAVAHAKKIIEDDDADNPGIFCVYVNTNVQYSNGSFTTAKTERYEH